MISGKDTLQKINDHILQAQSQIENAGQRMNELVSRHNTLRFEIAEQYRQLAKIRLDELNAGRIISRLDQADQSIAALLDQRSQALEDLQNKLKASLSGLQKLEQERVLQQNVRDKAIEKLQRQIEKTRARIEKADTYQHQKKKTALVAQVSRRAAEKASQSENDLTSKGKPYQDDSIFMYLWQRRFMTPDYHAGPLARLLDNWVSSLIDFKEARANYHMLNELPLRLREHAEKAAQDAERQTQILQAMEKEAANQDGISKLQSELENVEKYLHQIDNDIEAGEANHQKLLERQKAFASGEDEFNQKAIERLAADFEQEDLYDLYKDAQATPRPEDDAIVLQIRKLEQEEKKAQDQISLFKETQQEQQRALEQLTQLRQRFRRRGYDAYNSSFPSNLGLGVLLGTILRGGMSSGSAWDKLKHGQRWDRSPDFGGFGGSGGFGSGGGFGGGGFRTGGEF